MNEDKATPRPWTLAGEYMVSMGKRPIASTDVYNSNQDTMRHREENQANAQLIVRAVNNHEALVEALRKITERYKPIGATREETLTEIRNIARDALKKAGEL